MRRILVAAVAVALALPGHAYAAVINVTTQADGFGVVVKACSWGRFAARCHGVVYWRQSRDADVRLLPSRSWADVRTT